MKIFKTNQWRSALLAVAMASAGTVTAQERMHVYMNDWSARWNFPIVTDSIDHATVSSDEKQLLFHLHGGVVVPFAIDLIDSVTVENEPAVETKDAYKVFQLYVTTNDGKDVTSREEYAPCHISLNGQGSFSNYSATGGIRGRGNSSWSWYDKKPYRIKLDEKHKILGLDKAKSWVLLANYRDVTDLMNTYVFETGQWLGLPYTNHTRYVELYLNGDYRGVYQLTEQIQQGKNRVNVSDERGILLSLDVDDGPGESPYANDNFYSKVYRMPAAVKFPKDEFATTNTVDSVRTEFAKLEQAIKNKDYAQVEQLLDIPSFIKYLQLQEFVYNVELSAPRSIYLHKDGDGKWVMGPLWDFDGGYDFDWNNMYTGHTFFSNYKETVMGTNPLKRNGNYNYVPQFFTDLFGCREFVEQYKSQWASVSDSIVTRNWEVMEKYIMNLNRGPMTRDAKCWPLGGKEFRTEMEKMHQWLINRCNYLSNLVANIPMSQDDKVNTDSVVLYRLNGYNQSTQIHVDKEYILRQLGIDEAELIESYMNIVPLMNDGSEGANNTNGRFGGWFNQYGEPQDWYHGHVYIEVLDDLWNWNCGIHPDNCYDKGHTVTMQYQYPINGILKKVNVDVHFTIEESGW